MSSQYSENDSTSAPSTSATTTNLNSSNDQENTDPSPTNPKLYKTTLCQFYLQGPCKNGDKCSYAHGTSELRSSSGLGVAEVGSKAKTKLCEKFIQFGDCPFGVACSFAHGVREMQKALSTPVS